MINSKNKNPESQSSSKSSKKRKTSEKGVANTETLKENTSESLSKNNASPEIDFDDKFLYLLKVRALNSFYGYKSRFFENFRTIFRLLGYLREEGLKIVLAWVSALITGILQTRLPRIVAEMIDSVLINQNADDLNSKAIEFLVVCFAYSFFEFVWGYSFSISATTITNKLRKKVHNSVIQKELEYFEKNHSSNIINKIDNEVSSAQAMCTHHFSSFLRNLIQLIYGAYCLVSLSPFLLIVLIAVAPLTAISNSLYSRMMKSLNENERNAFKTASLRLLESLQSIKLIKAFSSEKKEIEAYNNHLDDHEKVMKKINFAWSIHIGISGMISNCSLVMIVYAGMKTIGSKDLTPGNLSNFLLLAIGIAGSYRDLNNSINDISNSIHTCKSLFQTIDEKPKINHNEGIELKEINGKISFQDVNFAYNENQIEIIKNMNLTINPGESIAFVGKSGGGKSTIVSLILRLYDSTKGKILIDDHDIRDLNLMKLHEKIGYVPQESILFSGTIEENLTYGIENHNFEKLNKAIKQANADFIFNRNMFPNGLQSIVGEKGCKLSGGQKQRLAIARALLREPKILIFDEATSALDAESEKDVQRAIDNLIEDKMITIITIAHRLATIMKCKIIFVINEGKISEKGTHKELLIKGGLYQTLFESQLKLNS